MKTVFNNLQKQKEETIKNLRANFCDGEDYMVVQCRALTKRGALTGPLISESLDIRSFVNELPKENFFDYRRNQDYTDWDEYAIKDVFKEVSNLYPVWFGSRKDFRIYMFGKLRRDAIIQKVIKNLGGNHDIVMEFADMDPDSYGHRTIISSSTVADIVDELFNDRYTKDYHLLQIKSVQELGDHYRDLNDYDPLIWFGTVAERKECEAEKRRQELEGLAQQIAHDNNVKMNSLEFLSVVERKLDDVQYEQEHWNNPEVRMEEWAAHMYAGSREAYFDDLNFENGRYSSRRSDLVGILEWVSENCPLLWAKYEEQKLSEPDDI